MKFCFVIGYCLFIFICFYRVFFYLSYICDFIKICLFDCFKINIFINRNVKCKLLNGFFIIVCFFVLFNYYCGIVWYFEGLIIVFRLVKGYI